MDKVTKDKILDENGYKIRDINGEITWEKTFEHKLEHKFKVDKKTLKHDLLKYYQSFITTRRLFFNKNHSKYISTIQDFTKTLPLAIDV